MPRIIRIEKGDILPACRVKSAVSRPRDALLRGQQTDPSIPRRQSRRIRRALVLRAIVHQQQLPVRVRLPQHRLRRVRQRSRRVTVWNNDRALPHNSPMLFLAHSSAATGLHCLKLHSAPFPVNTTATVCSRILKSRERLQLSMYLRSSFTTSSKSVMSERPLTCHRPVRPGVMEMRRR